MGNYNTNLRARMAHARRQAIIRRLGGMCKMCGTTGTDDNKLEIDHKKPRTWRLEEFSQMGRVRIYEQEEKQDLLQCLCANCNKHKSNRVAAASTSTP